MLIDTPGQTCRTRRSGGLVLRPVDEGSGDTPGVFLVTPSETLSYHYERNPDDPRVEQLLTLAVDSFGVITRAATVHYPRRTPSVGTLDAQQARGECRITRTEVIHDTAGTSQWHVGLPYRSRTWKLQPEASEDPSTFYADKVTAADIGPLIALPVVTGSGSATTPVLAWDEAEPTDSAWLKKLGDTVTTYDDDGTELAAGTVGVRALVHQRYQLAFTEDQAADLLGRVGAPADLEALGYVERVGEDGWWARSGTQERDASNFYVSTALTDPFGNETTVAWHSSHLFPESVTDALGNVVTGTWDLRVLSPSEVTDPNGDQTRLAYDALGRVTAMAVVGNASEGDTLSSPTAEFEYETGSVPAWAWGRVRETHADSGTRWIETTSYSDGAGNVVMQKVTAAPDGAPRWIGSGRVVLNNKGLPIKQYEPFFSETDAFEAEEGFSGLTPLITYDPLGRAIRVDLPNGTLRRVEFSPWEQSTWDENDTVTESDWYAARVGQTPAHEEEDLALDAAEHADTPTTVTLDVQGRPYRTVERLSTSTELLTTLTLDAVGNPVLVTDPRVVEVQAQTFDLLGRPITTESPDGGNFTTLLDVAGQPLFVWKSGDLGIETEVDALRRPVRTWEWDTDAETRVQREHYEYGEAEPDPEDLHLRGRLVRVLDTAGLLELSYDFKGNVLTTTRRFFDDDEQDIDWSVDDPEEVLEEEEFTVAATFDAMNRVLTRTTPDGAVTELAYDEGGRLRAVEVDEEPFVEDIQHNARGQRTLIEYGNGVSTTSTYEPLTFRLHTLVSSGGRQSLEYAYDPVGNILGILNDADDTLYFDNAAVEPHQEFEYDALYRLTNAWGREKSARGRADWTEPTYGPVPDASETMQGYEQRYVYDVGGNITEMRHLLGGTTDWVREYTYPSTSNRLSTTTEIAGTLSYTHDVRGNIVFWPHLFNDTGSPPNVAVDFRDQMRRAQLNGSDYAVYHYDHSGQRARKVVKRGANVEERRYVAGWEVWRKTVSGTLTEERTTLHVMDDERRVAMIETKTVTGGSPVTTLTPRVRYQLDNHLGTSVLELDESGGVISYEEYHPYGTCAWWAGDGDVVSQRRYRYTGMERDEETGLAVHGVRYYAAWLGRWGSADPIGLGDGGNRFMYARGKPVGGRDPSGLSWVDAMAGTLNSVKQQVKAVAAETMAEAGRRFEVAQRAVNEVSSEAFDTWKLGVDIIRRDPVGVATDVYMENTPVGLALQGDLEGAQGVYLEALIAPAKTVVTAMDSTQLLPNTAKNTAEVLSGELDRAKQGVRSQTSDTMAVVETGLLVLPALGSAPRGRLGLVHLTTPEAAASIRATGTLGRGGGNYAGPSSNASATGFGITWRTGLPPSKAGVAIEIPDGALSAFSKPVPFGPISTWQRLTGQQFTQAGKIDLATGTFTATGANWNQRLIYGLDLALDTTAAVGGALLHESAQ